MKNKFKTVEDFYEYMGQCNMFKPKFSELSDERKAELVADFEMHNKVSQQPAGQDQQP